MIILQNHWSCNNRSAWLGQKYPTDWECNFTQYPIIHSILTKTYISLILTASPAFYIYLSRNIKTKTVCTVVICRTIFIVSIVPIENNNLLILSDKTGYTWIFKQKNTEHCSIVCNFDFLFYKLDYSGKNDVSRNLITYHRIELCLTRFNWFRIEAWRQLILLIIREKQDFILYPEKFKTRLGKEHILRRRNRKLSRFRDLQLLSWALMVRGRLPLLTGSPPC